MFSHAVVYLVYLYSYHVAWPGWLESDNWELLLPMRTSTAGRHDFGRRCLALFEITVMLDSRVTRWVSRQVRIQMLAKNPLWCTKEVTQIGASTSHRFGARISIHHVKNYFLICNSNQRWNTKDFIHRYFHLMQRFCFLWLIFLTQIISIWHRIKSLRSPLSELCISRDVYTFQWRRPKEPLGICFTLEVQHCYYYGFFLRDLMHLKVFVQLLHPRLGWALKWPIKSR